MVRVLKILFLFSISVVTILFIANDTWHEIFAHFGINSREGLGKFFWVIFVSVLTFGPATLLGRYLPESRKGHRW